MAMCSFQQPLIMHFDLGSVFYTNDKKSKDKHYFFVLFVDTLQVPVNLVKYITWVNNYKYPQSM